MERLENHYIHYSNNAALILDLGTKIRTATSQAGKYILYQYVVSFTKVENAVNECRGFFNNDKISTVLTLYSI